MWDRLEDALWLRVDIGTEESCWEWRGALSVLLKHEWVEHTGLTDDRIDVFKCPGCDGWKPEHKPDCALGAIVAEAKRLGEK